MSVARKFTRTHHCRCGMTAQPNQASACFSDNIILCRTFGTSWLRKTCAQVKLAANCEAKIADDSNVQKRRMFCVFASLRKQANAWKQCNYMEHSFFLRHSAGSQSVAASHDETGVACVLRWISAFVTLVLLAWFDVTTLRMPLSARKKHHLSRRKCQVLKTCIFDLSSGLYWNNEILKPINLIHTHTSQTYTTTTNFISLRWIKNFSFSQIISCICKWYLLIIRCAAGRMSITNRTQWIRNVKCNFVIRIKRCSSSTAE